MEVEQNVCHNCHYLPRITAHCFIPCCSEMAIYILCGFHNWRIEFFCWIWNVTCWTIYSVIRIKLCENWCHIYRVCKTELSYLVEVFCYNLAKRCVCGKYPCCLHAFWKVANLQCFYFCAGGSKCLVDVIPKHCSVLSMLMTFTRSSHDSARVTFNFGSSN